MDKIRRKDVEELLFDEALIRKYDVQGPRYTSYPTASQFTQKFEIGNYIASTRD